MKIYVAEEAAHTESDLGPLIAAAELGDKIERYLLDPKHPVSMMLDRARDEFIAASLALLEADLQTSSGIEQARSLQAQARRYCDMCRWITDALEERADAVDDLNGAEEDAAVEELKDIIDASRAKPAPDA